MKRVFLAIDTSDEAKAVAAERVSAFRKEFSDIRASWVRTENLHTTLKFIGDADDSQIETLSKHLAASLERFVPFTVGLGSPLAFGKRILGITIDDASGTLNSLNRIFESSCERIGVPRETRSFKPHLTLARIRDERGTRELISKHTQTQIEPVEWQVREIVLYESKLQPTGSVYSKLKTFTLRSES